MKNHTDFILKPITDILKDVVLASAGTGSGIETYPLCDYIMQSVFLKMTGFQEQKMKCICWELATSDYEYRYKRYSQKTLGECSCYDEKKIIYKDLIDQIKKRRTDFDVSNDIDKIEILSSANSEIKDIFFETNLSIWAQSSFTEFMNSSNLIQHQHFANNSNLFESNLQTIYKMLYHHRNRCAHNTQSYQQNLPTLKTLVNENYRFENYFIWFTLIVLIDKIFIELYKNYLECLEDHL